MYSKKIVQKTVRRQQRQESKIDLIPEKIAKLMYIIRGEKILIDADLADLYGVETGALNRAVKRNAKRFPKDFMFQLSPKEWQNLKCQFGISSLEVADKKDNTTKVSVVPSSWHGGRRTPPYTFTEQGVAMLSSVLNVPRAIEVNIAIMRTFVQLRQLMEQNRLLADKIESLEAKYMEHEENFQAVFKVIKQLISDQDTHKSPKRRAGFHTD